MPTTRPRYQVTETAELARTLDAAARRWPGESRSRLLLRVLQAGAQLLDAEEDGAVRERRKAIEATSGKYADAFGPDHLSELRRDFPA